MAMTDKLTSALAMLDDAIQGAYRVAVEESAFGRGDEYKRRRSALQLIDRVLVEEPLAAAKAEHLLLLEVLLFYWCELVSRQDRWWQRRRDPDDSEASR
jgi:hypothetical protein